MLVVQMFHHSWDFDARLPLEGDRSDYRMAVIRGRQGKVGTPVGLRRTFSILRASPPDENQDIGVSEDEKESEVMNEEPIIEETPEETAVETPVEESTTENVEDETPLDVEAPVEEEPVIEEPVPEITEPEPEIIVEPEPVVEEVIEEVVEEPEVEVEVPKPVDEPESQYTMKFVPETPVFSDGKKPVIVLGQLYGFLPQDVIHVTIEKSTSVDNGWKLWTERGVSLNGERTSVFA